MTRVTRGANYIHHLGSTGITEVPFWCCCPRYWLMPAGWQRARFLSQTSRKLYFRNCQKLSFFLLSCFCWCPLLCLSGCLSVCQTECFPALPSLHNNTFLTFFPATPELTDAVAAAAFPKYHRVRIYRVFAVVETTNTAATTGNWHVNTQYGKSDMKCLQVGSCIFSLVHFFLQTFSYAVRKNERKPVHFVAERKNDKA